ncbi:MAG: peptidoglycan editing factor PgeF [bacterium]
MSAPPRASPLIFSASLGAARRVRHGFYGRRDDADDSLATERQRVADDLGAAMLFSNRQVHGDRVRVIEVGCDADEVFDGDGLVTRAPGVALGVLSADCAPVLFADASAAVIGAAHAGWRGALLGVTDAVIARMTDLGARPRRIECAIGPAIQARSYRVGAQLRRRFEADSPLPCACCFDAADEDDGDGAYRFDLPRYLRLRLARAGVGAVDALAADTFADPARFFSYRREPANPGRQISAIALA